MFSSQSPFKLLSGGTSESSCTSSPAPLHVHGLFGETNGIDDLPSTFSIQSPPCGSYSFSKQALPSQGKSPGAGSTQQPVLLSDLAECPLLDQSDLLYQRNPLCSFISQYDNSRCTDSAFASYGNGRNYCRKHLQLQNSLETGSTGLLQHMSSNTPERSGITLNSLNGDINPRRYTSPGGGFGVDLTDSCRALSFSGKTDGFTPPFPTTVPPSLPTPLRKVKTPPRKQVKIKQVTTPASASKTKATKSAAKPSTESSMDPDVLQAVVDLLNQNHDRLTTKQQVELLNSLGIVVATVKGQTPEKPVNKQQQPQKQLLTAGLHQQGSKVKRKLADGEAVTAKKPKASSDLTLEELDKKVYEALSSVRSNIATLKKSTPTITKPMLTPQTTATTGRAAPRSRGTKNPLQIVEIPAHSRPKLVIPDNISASLRKYVDMELERRLNESDLFPFDALCNDKEQGICTCEPGDNLVLQQMTSKQHSYRMKAKWARHKQAPCRVCQNPAKPIPSLHSTVDVIKSISEHAPDIASTSRQSRSKDDELKGDELKDDELKDDELFIAKLKNLRKAKARCKKAIKHEKSLLRLLIRAARTDMRSTVTTLRRLDGKPKTKPPKKPAVCRGLSKQCVLEDVSTGARCKLPAMPLTPYCREHLWHHDDQCLYKLGADMRAGADIFPEPVPVRPRKKTKPLPLSKRKKRKPRKVVRSAPTADHLKSPAKQTPQKRQQTPPKIAMTSSSPGEDASVLDAFGLDSDDDVIPEVFQELGGFLSGQSSGTGVLDSALLALDEKFSFDDDLFASSPPGAGVTKQSTLDFPDVDSFASTVCDDVGDLCLGVDDVIARHQRASPSLLQWGSNSSDLNQLSADHMVKHPGSCLDDETFADDLNELEGVIESLRQESATPLTSSCPASLGSAPVASCSAPAMSCSAPATFCSAPLTSCTPVMTTEQLTDILEQQNKIIQSNPSTSSRGSPSLLTFQSNLTSPMTSPITTPMTSPLMTSSETWLTNRGVVAHGPVAPPGGGGGGRARTADVGTTCHQPPQQQKVLSQQHHFAQVTENVPAVAMATGGGGTKAKNRRRSKSSLLSNGELLAGLQQCNQPATTTTNQIYSASPRTLRVVQPHQIIATNNLVCGSTAKVNNQTVFLIPVNAVVRNQQQGGQLGITFAVPTQQPSRGSKSRDPQPANQQQALILVNNNPETAVATGLIPQQCATTTQHHAPTFHRGSSQSSQTPSNHKQQRCMLAATPAQLPQAKLDPPPHRKLTTGGATVHWNGVNKGPTPPPPPSNQIGGQTANMMYCRRISPSLNGGTGAQGQHVIVGRLGSLGGGVNLLRHHNSDMTSSKAMMTSPKAMMTSSKAMMTSSKTMTQQAAPQKPLLIAAGAKGQRTISPAPIASNAAPASSASKQHAIVIVSKPKKSLVKTMTSSAPVTSPATEQPAPSSTARKPSANRPAAILLRRR